MTIATATRAEIEAARDELFKAAVLLQKYAQGEKEQAGAVADVDAQVTATVAALEEFAVVEAG